MNGNQFQIDLTPILQDVRQSLQKHSRTYI